MSSAVEIVNSRRNQYGPRQTDEFAGGEVAGGAWEKQMSVKVRGYALQAPSGVVVLTNAELAGLTLTKGAIVKAVTYNSKQSMGSGGTLPDLSLTDASGNVLGTASAAQLDAGDDTVADITGTIASPFDAPLAADTPIEVRVNNADNTFVADGQGEFTVHYYDVRG